MESKEFKQIFEKFAKKNAFSKGYGGWVKESDESVVCSYLQKSSYSNSYYLNIVVLIRGFRERNHEEDVSLLQSKRGDFFCRQPKEYQDTLNLELPMDDKKRVLQIEKLFSIFLVSLFNDLLSINGTLMRIKSEDIMTTPDNVILLENMLNTKSNKKIKWKRRKQINLQ